MAINHLAAENSPYLRQHAQNPVHWFPWGPLAFEKAVKEQKPIFLSIGYSTCHWCHVMAHESFENQSTADILNQYFIAIKVDREERPDIDHIYMNAVIAIAGQGGWPLSVFLKPDGQPFYGGTYFPPIAKWGSPAFNDVLLSMRDAWDHNQAGITTSSQELLLILQQSMAASSPIAVIDSKALTVAVTNLASQFDQQNGGFSHAPKFPMGHTLSFLLSMHGSDKPTLPQVEQTLTIMSARGIHDQIASGFHRYATDAAWQIPHFEKMLYDQALLVFAYAQCFQITQDPLYARVCRSIMDYVLSDMTSKEGVFYCAYDADAEGQEGAYYVFTHKEIYDQLDKATADVFAMYYGVQPQGNVDHDPHGEFQGQNILFQTRPLDPMHQVMMDQAKAKLLSFRRGRMALHLDDKVLTDWNGLMIAALAFGGLVLNDRRYIDHATKAADYILDNMYKNGMLQHRWHENVAGITAMLDDYAYLALGLVHLYEATFDQKYLQQAEVLTDYMVQHFEDQHGGFFMSPENNDLIVRPVEIYDGAMPSGNSVAAVVLMKLFFLTDKTTYQDVAIKTFKRFLPTVLKAPQGYTYFLQALQMHVAGPLQVTIRGKVAPQELVSIQNIVYKCFKPNLSIKREPSMDPWSVQICKQGVCGLPITDMKMIERQLI